MSGRKRVVDIVEYVPTFTSQPSGSSIPTLTHHTHYERRRRPVKLTVTSHIPEEHTVAEPTISSIDVPSDILEDGGLEHMEYEVQETEIHGLPLYQDDTETGDVIEVSRKRHRTQGDHPLLTWIEHIDEYLIEFLRLEGRGDAFNQDNCAASGCQGAGDMEFVGYRCEDCCDNLLYCRSCTLKIHRCLPFHRIHEWNGLFFEKVTLKALGLRIQLGHTNGVCSAPQPAYNDDFVVIDADGIHQVGLDYCGCQQAAPKTVQLLRSRLFPATVTDPKTAATFRVLESFQMLTFTSKMPASAFYQALARRTDNTGTCRPPDRYQVFLRIVREWRHIRLLKRFGRGHDPSGWKGTKEGECAVLCPACPMPGINLPADWKERPSTEQWLYALFVGIDANFRLKRMNVSTDARDPGLNHGYAYLVERESFEKYLGEYGEKIPDDKSSCNNHDAIKSASMRGGKATAASGLGTVECSRHDMKRPTAVGDLQKGERYVNMDYFLLSTLRHIYNLIRLVISYDIACQWCRKFLARCQIYPQNCVSASPAPEILFLVPKFHLPAHIAACQIDYSFNLTPGVGRTDGEAPERGWSDANALAASTREMGPGSRRDTLDDNFGDYNWQKITSSADTFLRKAEEAIKARQEHVEAFLEFNAALPEDSTRAWTKMCQDWEKDRTKENPFRVLQTSTSESDVRLRLAMNDSQALDLGKRYEVHNHVAPGLFIYLGLELEDLQRRLALETAELGSHATSLQRAKVLERSNTLRRRIDAWVEIQHLYIPPLASIRMAADQEGGGKPLGTHEIELYLPSQIHSSVHCDILLLQHEWELRYAQAHSTLNDLRGLLLMESMMLKSKWRHSRGQRQQTRSVNLLKVKRVKSRIDAAASKYRHVWKALQSLAVPLHRFNWGDVLKVLEDDDMATLTSLDNETSEGRKKLKWIWTVQGTGAKADKSTQSALRVEWCKARARAHRWQEECLLLHEEMRRVLATFDWQCENWGKIARQLETMNLDSSQTTPSLAQADILTQSVKREGQVAYAYRQAAIRKKMRNRCEMHWEKCRSGLLVLEGFNATVMVECF